MNNPKMHGKVFILFLSIVTLAFFWILLPFYGAIFWGVILAIIFMPLNNYFLDKMSGRKNTAAISTLFVCLLIAIIPITIVSLALADESAMLYQRILTQKIDFDASFRFIFSQLPNWVINLLNHFDLSNITEFQQKISNGLLQISQYLAARIFVIGQNIFDFTIGFFIMIYLLFFLLRDGKELSIRIRDAIPLEENQKILLLNKFTGVIRATVKGNLIIALVQGALGGLIYWILGIEASLLWGAIMALCSLLPAGSSVIWIPATIYFLVTGAIFKGIILLIFGILVIGLIDNFLRPLLVGKDTQIPDYLILISTIGGIALFGLNGFVIGPMIAALFITTWELLSISNLPIQIEDKENKD